MPFLWESAKVSEHRQQIHFRSEVSRYRLRRNSSHPAGRITSALPVSCTSPITLNHDIAHHLPNLCPMPSSRESGPSASDLSRGWEACQPDCCGNAGVMRVLSLTSGLRPNSCYGSRVDFCVVAAARLRTLTAGKIKARFSPCVHDGARLHALHALSEECCAAQ